MHCRLWCTDSTLLVAKVAVIKFCNLLLVTRMVQIVGHTPPRLWATELSIHSTFISPVHNVDQVFHDTIVRSLHVAYLIKTPTRTLMTQPSTPESLKKCRCKDLADSKLGKAFDLHSVVHCVDWTSSSLTCCELRKPIGVLRASSNGYLSVCITRASIDRKHILFDVAEIYMCLEIHWGIPICWFLRSSYLDTQSNERIIDVDNQLINRHSATCPNDRSGLDFPSRRTKGRERQYYIMPNDTNDLYLSKGLIGNIHHQ